MILVLFDIDLTLVDIMDFHRKIVREVFRELYGVEADLYAVNPYGKPVNRVIKELCEYYKVLYSGRIKELWVKKLKEQLTKEDIKILPGVFELLEELRGNVELGILTGNPEPVGKLVLEKAGLLKYFKVFGFTKHETDRAEVLERVLDQGTWDKVVVIGDSPQDILAAKKEGVYVIGVATGIYTEKELEEAGADLVISDLKTGKEKIIDFLFTQTQTRLP